jgi:3-ketoacyl-CoA synthase
VIELNKTLAVDIGWKAGLLLAILFWFLSKRESTVYLIDFTTFEPPASWKLSHEQIMEIMKLQRCFTDESLKFLDRMLSQSGVGPATAWPPGKKFLHRAVAVLILNVESFSF